MEIVQVFLDQTHNLTANFPIGTQWDKELPVTLTPWYQISYM
jgi:hypothetical protein